MVSRSPPGRRRPGSSYDLLSFAVSGVFFACIVACGGSGIFGDKDGKTGPSAEPTVMPPVPVSGSYITSVLVDENNLPIAQADVRTEDGLLFSRTDSAGVFRLPITLMHENSFDLDVKRNGQEVPLRLKPCPHMLAAINAIVGTDGLEAALVMAVRLASTAVSPANDPATGAPVRLLTDSIAVPKETGRSFLKDAPLLQFKVKSPLSGSSIQPDFVFSGECAVGYLVKVFGDVAAAVEVTCINVGGRGSFTVNASAKNRNGSNAIVFEHIEPTTKALVSQLVLLHSAP
ncbi:MAG: hypothetical protein RI932_230 [Pseudomonadota bacterium]|jgi:hypothetical protein